MDNQLEVFDRSGFRQWLSQYAQSEKECWLKLKRGRPKDDDQFYYLDAVEEALCFGWIDSTLKKVDGQTWQRFSPRRPKSNWTELNKARVQRLEALGLMTDLGRQVLPEMSFQFDPAVVTALEEAGVWEIFQTFPTLYQRVKAGNLAFYRHRQPATYQKMLERLIDQTRQGKLYGDWNDYGRLG